MANQTTNTAKIITVPEALIKEKADLDEKIYLSDLEEFKDNNLSILYNTVFNKSVTGIGGTSVVLDSEEDIIILMPFVEVVNNKQNYNKETFIIMEGVEVPSIARYLRRTRKRKIVSTFDGLSKIKQAYERAKIDLYKDFLMVDEWQVIFHQYGLRHKAMRLLLDESVKFDKKCFMTATPIKKEYWFPEFEGLTELILNYDLASVPVYHYRSKNIIDETVAIINSQEEERNYHFFINSVDTIKTIVKTMKLKPKDVRIICSKRDKNEAKLTGYKIESTTDPVKKLNFYTSTCFEGCDIYDESGKMFVLCDGLKAHSLVDVSTMLPQIAGRIRDIKDPSINLIYSNSNRYINVTEEEFNKSVDKNIEAGRNIINDYKIITDDTKEMFDDNKLNDRYLIYKDGKIFFEEVLLNVDKANFETSKTYEYRANLSAKLSGKFYPVKVVRPWAEEIEKYQEQRFNRLSFREKCQLYNDISKNTFSIIPKFEKDVMDAVDILGMDRLEEMNFHKGDVKKALISRLSLNDEQKVMKALNFTKGRFYTTAEINGEFEKTYNILGINKKVKSTDIKKYYEVKSEIQTVRGKKARGFTVIMPKVVLS